MIPWWLRIATKLVLTRIPIGYRLFAAIGIFRHGRMHDASYAMGVFARHFERTGLDASDTEFVGLEFGVGDSIASALLTNAHGASKCYLVDAGKFSVEDLDTYRSLAKALTEQGRQLASMDNARTFDDVLELYNGVYLTDGLRSLQTIPTESVDFIWSNAVLEHVRRAEFEPVMTELRRILKPGGVVSHRVDLKDHLGGALNNHCVSTNLWEKDWFARSGFYTNRISYSQMLDLFERCGFAIEVVQVDRWESLPTAIEKMAPEFQSLDETDLLVSGFDVLLRSKG